MDTQGESWEHIFSYDQYTCIITGKKEIYRHSLSNNRLEKIASLTELGDTGVITGSLRGNINGLMFTAHWQLHPRSRYGKAAPVLPPEY